MDPFKVLRVRQVQVLPCIANVILRLSYKLRAHCGSFALEVLSSLGVVGLAGCLASAFLVLERRVVWELLPSQLLASLLFLGLTGAVNLCLWCCLPRFRV